MMSTPTIPMPMASQRRQPTFSPRKIAAAPTTTIGVACKIAVVADSEVSASAKV